MNANPMKPVTTLPIRLSQWGSVAIGLIALAAALSQGQDFWSTPDQRGQHLLNAGKYADAAAAFNDPFRRGAALVEARDYKSAASVYATLPGPEAAFNHGNALVMLGEYDNAIQRYDRALELRPEWSAALQNREIAILRREKMKDEPGIGTDGELGADEIVFDLDNSKNAEAGEEETDSGQASDDELRQLWLRQVQTTPRDFLKSKFAFQEAIRASEQVEQESKP